MDEIMYYEMSDYGIKKYGHRYYFAKINDIKSMDVGPITMAYPANRMWKLDKKNNTVTWVKNRFLGTDAPIDEKEFLLVQLAALPAPRRRL